MHNNPNDLIVVDQLSKYYRVANKQPGFKGTLKHFFDRKTYDVPAVTDISFKISPGEVVGFLGANGAGKTTLLKMMCGLIHPSTGLVDVGGFSPQNKSLYIIAGNNGSGKTTFIGKFINLIQKNGLKPGVIAADTFRAAAIDQLEHFTNQFEVPIHKGNKIEDPSAVIFQGIDNLEESDVIIVDTSGRQHNNKNLMAELKKISDIVSKKSYQFNLIRAFLTLDANTGLASKHIIEGFQEYIPLDGIIDSEAELKKLNMKKQVEQEKFNKVNDKLKNDNFMNKASEEIINKFKNEANIYKSSIEKIDQIINTIK